MFLVLLVAAAACTDARLGDPGELVCGREWVRQLPLDPRPAIDLLLVLDRTPSMADEAERLAQNAAQLADVLQQVDGGVPDLHVAVVTSDLGGAGVPGCGAGDGARFLGGERCGLEGTYLDVRRRPDGTLEQNFSGSLRDAFACLLELPLSTCPVSQPLAALVRAVDGNEPANDGFRRDGAYLYFVVISDGDDCSIVDGEAFAGITGDTPAAMEAAVDQRCFARGASCSPGNPAIPGIHDHCVARTDAGFAGIAASIALLGGADEDLVVGTAVTAGGDVRVGDDGTLASVCQDTVTAATGAPRLAALTAVLSRRWAVADVCGENWSDVLSLLGWSGWGIVNPCAEVVLDVEPLAPGLQVDCVGALSDRRGDPVAILPMCGGRGVDADAMCLRLVADLLQCPQDGFSFEIEPRDEVVPVGALLDLRCRIPCGD